MSGVRPRVRPVILCGGSGTRLWPLSRRSRPKQLLALTGEATLLQQTAQRLADAAKFAPPLVVAGAGHADRALSQLDAAGIAPEPLVIEPEGRNTAAALAVAAHLTPPDSIIVAMPSDHSISDVPAFRAAIDRAVALARDDWIATLGIAPTRPETGYGYIEAGAAIGDGVAEVERFVEKPALDTAIDYLARGNFLWNGGIFVFRSGAFLAQLRTHARLVHDLAGAAVAGGVPDGRLFRPADDPFLAMPSVSIDCALMEKADRLAVVPVEMGWSDVGSWDALNALKSEDSDGNRLRGNVLVRHVSDCAVHSEGPRVVAIGVENLTIVATPDAILVMAAGRSGEVGEMVRELQARRCPTLE